MVFNAYPIFLLMQIVKIESYKSKVYLLILKPKNKNKNYTFIQSLNPCITRVCERGQKNYEEGGKKINIIGLMDQACPYN